MGSDEEIRVFLRDQSRDWLRFVVESTGMTPNAIAKKAGVSTANLNKLLNQPDFPHPMSETVKLKISRATGVALPSAGEAKSKPSEPKGFAEIEVVPYRPMPDHMADRPWRNGLDWWEIRTDCLDLEGFLPGDKVLVDLNRQPRPGDIVVAQMTSGQTVRTVFRKFEPPMLTCHCTARNYPRPEYVDGERVVIMGVVIEQRRKLHTEAA